MKLLRLNITNEFQLEEISRANVYSKEINANMILIKGDKTEHIYNMHFERKGNSFTSQNIKVVMPVDYEDGFFRCVIPATVLDSKGELRMQLRAFEGDYAIESNIITLDVEEFINATGEPTPEEIDIIEKLQIAVVNLEAKMRQKVNQDEFKDEIETLNVAVKTLDQETLDIYKKLENKTDNTEFAELVNEVVDLENDFSDIETEVSKLENVVSIVVSQLTYAAIAEKLYNNDTVLTDAQKLKIETWLGLDENYLTYYNATPYQVNGNYVPAHKKYVDEAVTDIKADLSQKIESKDLKTINGNSIVGSGDIEIKGGESIDYDINIKNVNHRGWYEAPENTLPAYQLSKRNGFKYVECDVALTSDKIPVLLHDLTIDRTSNGSGAISEMTFSEVRGYDFGSWKNTKYVGTLIPSFDEFILMCKNLGISPYVELKANGAYSTDDIECVVGIVKKHGMLSNVTWISMSKVYLGYVKNILTDARLGYVVGAITDAKINDAIALRTESNDVFIDAQLSDVTDVMVDMCVNNNIPLEVWTVDSVDDVKRMNSYISGVTSNKLISGKVLCDYEISKDYTHQLPSFSFFTIRKTSSYVAGQTGVDSQTLPDDANATYTTSNINDKTGDLVIKISDLVENYSDGKKFGEINIYAYDANGDYVGYLNPATYYSTGKTFNNSGFPSEITLKEEWFSKSSSGFSSIMRDSVIHLPQGFKVKACMRRSNGTYITDNYEFSNFIMTHQNFIYIDT